MESFINAIEGVALAIVNAYGYANPSIIEELLLILKGKLLIDLQSNNNIELDDDIKWKINDPLKYYWNTFEKNFRIYMIH